MPELPDRPNLEQLKKQVKSLLRSAQAGDAAALARFAALPAFAAGLDARDPALHDAQSVIAREHGFPSWNALRDEVEARTLSFDEAADAFVRAASDGARGRAARLLELYPAIATSSLEASVLLGDVAAVEARLAANPALATRPGGPQGWEPLLYACHTCLADTPARRDGLVAIARRLLALGADPNGQYHWNWHPELPRTVLWASLCVVRHLPLAEALLDAGANPTDGVSAHIAGGGGDLAALDLLARYGLDVNGIPGGVPPLVHMLLWSTDAAGPRWLLEHGANPNLAWGADQEAPLHVAARRWDETLTEALIQRGADVSQRRADGRTARTLAELNGNHAVARVLAAHGAADELTPIDRFVAACARGDRAAADAMRAADPSLPAALQPEHHRLMHRFAESGNATVLQTMLACGFDVDARDADRVTPLQRAAMAGAVDAVRVLLEGGADVRAVDGMFAASPLVWAVEGRRYAQPGSDHVAVARLLIAAGVPLDWTPPEGAPGPEKTQEDLMTLRRDAAAS
jgi:ankyrin repeat protein